MMHAGQSKFPKPGPSGSLSQLHQFNQRLLCDELREHGPGAQAELSRRTGLSKATISNLVRKLLAQGQVETTSTIFSGRRATLVSLVSTNALVVGIDFGYRHTGVAVVTNDKRIVAYRQITCDTTDSLEQRVAAAQTLARDLCGESKLNPNRICGYGVGISAPIDRVNHMVMSAPMLPQWAGVDLVNQIESSLKKPTTVGNDAALAALSESIWGVAQDVDNLVFVLVSRGIGAGMILDGRIYHGDRGLSGEIGHLEAADTPLLCRCGNTGCLEVVASIDVLVEQVRETGAMVDSVADVRDLAFKGDVATRRVIEHIGSAIGRATAQVANVLDPQMIVIGGDIVPIIEFLLPQVQANFQRKAMPSIAQQVLITASARGQSAVATGAAALALSLFIER